MAQEIQKGDVVQLKSGGPEMTVTGKDQLGGWICQWFKDGEAKSKTFSTEALEKVES